MGSIEYFIWWIMRGISRHDEVLNYLRAFQSRHFRMPTSKELKYDLKMSHGVLFRILNNLVFRGKIKRITPHVLPYKVMK